MKIALVGGTGDIGTGFAVRWAANHEIIIGSRKAEKAAEGVKAVRQILDQPDQEVRISCAENSSAIAKADLVVLCVPFEHLQSVTVDLRGSYVNQIVISPVVPMSYNGKIFQFTPPAQGSAALLARSLLPESVKVVSAFHTIAAASLQNRAKELKGDTFLCGDDPDALETVAGLAGEIRAIRPLKLGPLATSALAESLTPMLLNVGRRNKIRDAGISIVSEMAV
ncbi:MAG TPA: NADPH-dependent F420 reductase [Methanothrix sp.]|nr:NADPH-dependent F420 reductase [Methanothrix sp.]